MKLQGGSLSSWRRRAASSLLLLISIFLLAHAHTYANKERAVPDPVKLSSRLEELFSKSKILCFGRFAIEVPQEATLSWGSINDIGIFVGGLEEAKLRVKSKTFDLRRKADTAEITYEGPGPIEDSWQLRYYEDAASKKYGLHFFGTYISKGGFTFMLGDATGAGETENIVVTRQHELAKSLRLRHADEIPKEPGFCIEHAFMTDDRYADQETVSVGINIPSLPDVTFSLSSNKNAYADYDKEDFERMKRDELPLLARIKQAQKVQGGFYPHRDVLREGKRDVQHWHGEESLFRRSDGTHDFEWAFVGTPRDVANPSEFHVAMFTKVEHNMVGAAKEASVSDDEAVALWDKLLSGLKFRVKVPGAPPGSYYFPPTQQFERGAPK
jgi:hypothetical protein